MRWRRATWTGLHSVLIMYMPIEKSHVHGHLEPLNRKNRATFPMAEPSGKSWYFLLTAGSVSVPGEFFECLVTHSFIWLSIAPEVYRDPEGQSRLYKRLRRPWQPLWITIWVSQAIESTPIGRIYLSLKQNRDLSIWLSSNGLIPDGSAKRKDCGSVPG